jgi:integrase
MKNAHRLYRRANGIFYWQDNENPARQGSLRTRDLRVAERLLHAKNEAMRQPVMNLAMARTYLAAHDSKLAARTWAEVMAEMETHGIRSTQDRCRREFRSRAFDTLRSKRLLETTADDLLTVMRGSGVSVNHYLRRLHNLAGDLGWLPWPVLAKRAWPKIRTKRRRAVTASEHALIVASEKNPEKRAFYQFLWETGAAQSDAAEMEAGHIDWSNGQICYRRKKRGPDSSPARMTMGARLRALLETLPTSGPLFPAIKKAGANARATEFSRRCKVAGVEGVSLHSYRYAWAQRAKRFGYPARFAEEALGHNSRAVHASYARGGEVLVPSLEDYEAGGGRRIIPMSAPGKLKKAG